MVNKYIKYLFNIICFVMISVSLQAEILDDITIMSIRQKAMGGVGVTVSEDDHALHQNPAGLMSIEKFRLKMMYLNFGVGGKALGLVSDISSIKSSDPESKTLETFQKYVPADLDLFFSLSPIISTSWRGGGIGVYQATEIHGLIGNKAQPVLKLSGNIDGVGIFGLAKRFKTKKKSYDIGIAFKVLGRAQIYDKSTGEDEYILKANDSIGSTNKNKISVYGLEGGGLDIGIKTNYQTESFKGSYGFTFRNVVSSISGIKRVGETGNTTKKNIQGQLPLISTFGFSVEDSLMLFGKTTLAFDYRFISPETNIIKNVFMGAEKKLFNDIVALRGGMHQGFIVGGFGIDLVTFHLDYAFFAQELGEKIGHDSRISHHFQLAFLY